jgi:hypothetical protein
MQNSVVNKLIHKCMIVTLILCALMGGIHSDVCCFQRCKGYVGSEDWAVKRVWVCFFPEPTGDNFITVCLLCVFLFFTDILYDHNLIFS